MAGNNIQWICTQCGRTENRYKNNGRPTPGKCPRKTGDKPHSWVKNKTL